jgi:peptidyl-prolyl isomerase H (cyclophilin H)
LYSNFSKLVAVKPDDPTDELLHYLSALEDCSKFMSTSVSGSASSGSLLHASNPVVFLDVSLSGQVVGRIKIELFAHLVPRTAENFRQLCTGEYLKNSIPQGYKNAPFHRIIKDFMIQGGDFVRGDGSGSASIYGDMFEDEGFFMNHSGPGLVSMANSGANTNGCQFFITCAPCDFLDGKNVVVGRVLEGMSAVRKIEETSVGVLNRPKVPVVISECGQMF